MNPLNTPLLNSCVQLFRRALLAAIVWTAYGSVGWSQTTITFNTNPGAIFIPSYTENGFRFVGKNMEWDPDYRDASPNTDGMLRLYNSEAILRIEAVSGGTFDLLAIKMQTVGNSIPPDPKWTGTENLTGVGPGGVVVQASFIINQDWATYTLPITFRNLYSVTIPANFFGGFQVDDVVVVPGPVPEPGAAAIFICGTLLTGCMKARRRSRK